MKYIDIMKLNATKKGQAKFLGAVMECASAAAEMQVDIQCKQTKVNDFFKAN